MGRAAPRSAMAEWRRYGVLPMAAGIGFSTMAIQTYGIGPFVASIDAQLGWSRAEVMLGLAISNTASAAMTRCSSC